MALEALDDLGTGGLIGSDHLPEVFRVETAGEGRGIHQVAEQHGELTALGVSGTCGSRWGDGISEGTICLRWRRVHGLMRGGSWQWRRPSGTGPHQHGAILINGTLGDFDEFHLEIIKV